MTARGQQFFRSTWAVGVLLVWLLIGLWLIFAASSWALSPIAQGFTASERVIAGNLVSLVTESSDTVAPATVSRVETLLGVVVNDSSSLLTVTTAGAEQVQVATAGVARVLVSDINGAIERGDQITASPLPGIGMKATDNVKVIGVAQSDLTTTNASTQTYTTSDGTTKTTIIGEIPVTVNVGYFYKQPDRSIVPAAIQNLANAVAGREVNNLPILISLGIFIVTIIVVSSIVYSMIRSSIISVGRNPMSQSAIYRDMIQLTALVLGILVVATVAIYLVLTRVS